MSKTGHQIEGRTRMDDLMNKKKLEEMAERISDCTKFLLHRSRKQAMPGSNDTSSPTHQVVTPSQFIAGGGIWRSIPVSLSLNAKKTELMM